MKERRIFSAWGLPMRMRPVGASVMMMPTGTASKMAWRRASLRRRASSDALAVFDVLDGAVPADDFADFVSGGGRHGHASSAMTPSRRRVRYSTSTGWPVRRETLQQRGCAGCRRGGGPDPAVAEGLFAGEAGELLPAVADVEDHAFGVRRSRGPGG